MGTVIAVLAIIVPLVSIALSISIERGFKKLEARRAGSDPWGQQLRNVERMIDEGKLPFKFRGDRD